MLYLECMAEREDIGTMLTSLDIPCQVGEKAAVRADEVCIERVIRLYLNDTPIGDLVATPSQLRELGAGFVVSEGLASAVTEVKASGDEVRVYTREDERPRRFVKGSSGGLSMDKTPGRVSSDITIEPEDIFRVMDAIVSELWERTGGAHCSVLFSGRECVAKSSDVGRHNTVDKVVGFCVLNGIDLSQCILGCTGRQPAGMVSKAANAGIPIVISKAATTDEGVRLARQTGVTLVCRVKEGRFRVYSHPERIGHCTRADDAGA